MNREELLIEHRDFYGQYHHHKEQMAYAASVLYLAGAAALMYADMGSLGLEKTLQITFASVVFVAAFAFVVWQLRQRQLAADVVEACERLLTRLAGSKASPTSTDPRTYNGLHLPFFLVDELVIVAESRKPFRGACISELITYVTMLAAAVLVVMRMTC